MSTDSLAPSASVKSPAPQLPAESRFEPVKVEPPVTPAPYLTQPLLPVWAWAGIGLAVTVLAVAGGILGRKLFSRRPPPQPPQTPLDCALRQISAIPLESASLREVATTCSLAMRGFLQQEFGDPSLYMTHEEFVQSPVSLARLPDTLHSQTRQLLQELAHLKYAPQVANAEESVQLVHRTRDILSAIARANSQPPPGQKP